MESGQVLANISMECGNDGGFVALLDKDITKFIRTTTQFRGVEQIEPKRRPPFGLLLKAKRTCWEDEGSALASLLIHILLSYRKTIGKHWSIPLLSRCLEMVFLIPTDRQREPGKMQAAFVLYRTEQKVFAKFIHPKTGILCGTSFMVAAFETNDIV
jgi:hypothetical protein